MPPISVPVKHTATNECVYPCSLLPPWRNATRFLCEIHLGILTPPINFLDGWILIDTVREITMARVSCATGSWMIDQSLCCLFESQCGNGCCSDRNTCLSLNTLCVILSLVLLQNSSTMSAYLSVCLPAPFLIFLWHFGSLCSIEECECLLHGFHFEEPQKVRTREIGLVGETSRNGISGDQMKTTGANEQSLTGCQFVSYQCSCISPIWLRIVGEKMQVKE